MEHKDFERLESIILYGGTLEKVEVVENLFLVCKTVTDFEEKFIALKTGLSLRKVISEEYTEEDLDYFKFKSYICLYLAHSVIMVNGKNILTDRQNSIESLTEFFEVMDYEISVALFNRLIDNKNDEMSLVQVFPDFCQTAFARQFWFGIKNYKLNSYLLTGIPGYENVPLSYIQLLFLEYMNQEEWLKIRDVVFSFFKFIGNFIDPKTVRRVNMEELYQKAEEIADRRQIYREKYGVITRKDLQNQYAAMRSGELDEHDRIIREEERAQYEIWKATYLDKVRVYNESREKTATPGEYIKLDPSEEDLINEYLKIFKHSTWLLDELRAKNQENGS